MNKKAAFKNELLTLIRVANWADSNNHFQLANKCDAITKRVAGFLSAEDNSRKKQEQEEMRLRREIELGLNRTEEEKALALKYDRDAELIRRKKQERSLQVDKEIKERQEKQRKQQEAGIEDPHWVPPSMREELEDYDKIFTFKDDQRIIFLFKNIYTDAWEMKEIDKLEKRLRKQWDWNEKHEYVQTLGDNERATSPMIKKYILGPMYKDIQKQLGQRTYTKQARPRFGVKEVEDRAHLLMSNEYSSIEELRAMHEADGTLDLTDVYDRRVDKIQERLRKYKEEKGPIEEKLEEEKLKERREKALKRRNEIIKKRRKGLFSVDGPETADKIDESKELDEPDMGDVFGSD